MGTRANIIVQRGPQDYAIIYTHWDGYPSGNGVILDRFHNTHEAALELVANGDLSSLKERITPFPGEAHSFDKGAPFCTTFYGRDRKEDGTVARTYDTLQEALTNADNEYVYVKLMGEDWQFSEVHSIPPTDPEVGYVISTLESDLKPLAEFIANDEECQSSVARYDSLGVTLAWRDAGCPYNVYDAKYGRNELPVPLNDDGTIPETYTRTVGDPESKVTLPVIVCGPDKVEAPAPKKRKVATKAEKRGFAYENEGAWA